MSINNQSTKSTDSSVFWRKSFRGKDAKVQQSNLFEMNDDDEDTSSSSIVNDTQSKLNLFCLHSDDEFMKNNEPLSLLLARQLSRSSTSSSESTQPQYNVLTGKLLGEDEESEPSKRQKIMKKNQISNTNQNSGFWGTLGKTSGKLNYDEDEDSDRSEFDEMMWRERTKSEIYPDTTSSPTSGFWGTFGSSFRTKREDTLLSTSNHRSVSESNADFQEDQESQADIIDRHFEEIKKQAKSQGLITHLGFLQISRGLLAASVARERGAR